MEINKKNKKSMGRPLLRGKPLTKVIHTYLTEDEFETVKYAAKSKGIGNYIREILTKFGTLNSNIVKKIDESYDERKDI
jgi:hypothetical protein